MHSFRRLDWLDRICLSLIVALFVLSYYHTFLELIRYWASNDTYSYGFAVPLLSGILIWLKREEIAQVAVSPSIGLGTIVTAGGLMMLLVGRVSSTNLLEEISLVVTICGLTLLLFGLKMFGVLAFPLAYLFAMVPFWDYLTSRLQPYFQEYSAAVAVGLVRFLGVPVLRDGVIIALPNMNLQVAEACSGINYLLAVFCLGIPLTYLFVKSWPKRVFIVSMAVLIAQISNGLRVAVVCLFVYYGIRGPNGDIHGPFALFRTLLISGIGFLALLGLISHFADADRISLYLRAGEGKRRSTSSVLPRLQPLSVLLAVLMLSSFVGFQDSHQVTPVPLKRDLRTFPESIGGWRSRNASSFSSALDLVTFDERFSRNYKAPDGTELNLFLGYFLSQEQGRELAGYEIRNVLSGRERSAYTFPSRGGRRVNDFLTTVGGDTFYVMYWYVFDGAVVSEDYEAKLHTAWSSIVHGTTNGGIVVVTVKERKQEPIDVARLRVRDFIENFEIASKDYLPSR